jgi:mono/diheme cytochrome c family protein
MTFLSQMMLENYFRPTKKFPISTLLLIILTAGIFSAHAADIDKAKWNEGKSLFKSNCASCHNPKADGTGPALMGVTARWEGGGDYKGKTGKQWMYVWINNWHDAVNSGYPYAVTIRASRPAEMNVFAGILKTDDIDKILLYVENPDAGGPAVAAGPVAATVPTTPAETGTSPVLYVFVIFLVILIAILIGVTNKLDKIIDEKKGVEPGPAKIPFWKKTNFKVAVTLILIVYFGYLTVDATVHLGRQQGYQPEQPIRFSHALHAGTHKIDCQYCHQTAYKGKNSNIPSLNTCMNCHKQVSKGPKYGTEEIAKIYDAVGWDPTTKTYSKPAHPVEWVRIHNLPDHVFFSHAQHVNAGKVQCQTCHGPIETEEQVYQYSPLSMGWCINCHRQTEIQFASNNYYSTYEKIHQDLKNKTIDKVTVETIGGTECQKCHY